MTPSPIKHLFRPSCPATIAGFVASVVINSIDSFSSGSFAHVSKEVLEDEPAFANGDSASAVAFEANVFRTRTSSLHSSPRKISWRAFPSTGVSVRSWDAELVAPAVCHAPSFQVGEVRDGQISTVALTDPSSLTMFVSMRKLQGNEKSESLISDVEEWWHV